MQQLVFAACIEPASLRVRYSYSFRSFVLEYLGAGNTALRHCLLQIHIYIYRPIPQ